MAKLRLGLVVGALVVMVAAVVKMKPHLVFKVPKVGWMLGVAVGYDFPPTINKNVFAKCYDEKNCPWLKSGDVVVDACAKCGTNWMMTAVHELRTWDQPELKDFRDINEIVPWPEMIPHPAANRDHPESEWDVMWNNSKFKFREFKSHNPPVLADSKGIRTQLVPVRERRDVKFLVMVRNPEDIIFSMSVFFASMNPKWGELWGGMPGLGGSIKEILDVVLTVPYISPFTFFSSWMEFAGEENVLILHYSNVFKDTKRSLRIIADFVGIENITDEAIDEVNERVSFEFMKQKGHRYQTLVGYDKTLPLVPPNAMIKKGGVGSSKGALSLDEKKRVEELGLKTLGTEKWKMMYEGFEPLQPKAI